MFNHRKSDRTLYGLEINLYFRIRLSESSEIYHANSMLNRVCQITGRLHKVKYAVVLESVTIYGLQVLKQVYTFHHEQILQSTDSIL